MFVEIKDGNGKTLMALNVLNISGIAPSQEMPDATEVLLGSDPEDALTLPVPYARVRSAVQEVVDKYFA